MDLGVPPKPIFEAFSVTASQANLIENDSLRSNCYNEEQAGAGDGILREHREHVRRRNLRKDFGKSLQISIEEMWKICSK